MRWLVDMAETGVASSADRYLVGGPSGAGEECLAVPTEGPQNGMEGHVDLPPMVDKGKMKEKADNHKMTDITNSESMHCFS
jgi:hypothetical protein